MSPRDVTGLPRCTCPVFTRLTHGKVSCQTHYVFVQIFSNLTGLLEWWEAALMGKRSDAKGSWREDAKHWLDNEIFASLILGLFCPLDLVHTTGAMGWKWHQAKVWKWCWLFLEITQLKRGPPECAHAVIAHSISHESIIYPHIYAMQFSIWPISGPGSIGRSWT